MDRIESIVKDNEYVRSAAGFDEQPKALNGASYLLEQLFAEGGKHARIIIGVNKLPFGISVEVERTVEVSDFV